MLSRLAGLALALPFLLAHVLRYEPEGSAWRNAALWLLVGAIFIAADFAARRVARLPDGRRLVSAFAAISLTLALLGVMGSDYGFTQATVDLALLYVIFFVASAAAGVACSDASGGSGSAATEGPGGPCAHRGGVAARRKP